MKLGTKGVLIAAFSVLILFAFSVVSSQTSSLDPATLAPHIYQVELENERVRVLRVTARPGETPPLHSHPDRVLVYVNECSAVIATEDGGTRKLAFGAADVAWLPGETHGNQPNTVESECEILEIEIK